MGQKENKEQDTTVKNTQRTKKMDHILKREKLSDSIKKKHPTIFISINNFKHKDTKRLKVSFRDKDTLCKLQV